MKIKTQKNELQDYLIDASNLSGGYAEKLFITETENEIPKILQKANELRVPVTVSGARTGTVGGAIPFGGYIISLEKLKKLEVYRTSLGGKAIVGAGVLLADLQEAADAKGLFYPPDPTEWSCQIGGAVSTNASGSRSFKYGSTRRYVERLRMILPNGEFATIRRGETFGENGFIEIKTENGNKLKAKLPTYVQPNVCKNASGYFSAKKIDAIDLFIGSEGTLSVITEIELKLLPKPEGFLSGIVFFKDEKDLLNLVSEVKKKSFRKSKMLDPYSKVGRQINATALEYFDEKSLDFIREKFPETPEEIMSAILFEQETTDKNDEGLLEKWNELLEKHNADMEKSWFAANERDSEKMKKFRHALPISVNERIVKHKQRKVGTDISVPAEEFDSFLRFYKTKLNESKLDYVIFGHIGNNHLHVNIIPKNDDERRIAWHLYGRFIAQAVMIGGTVSAEHGIGKLKSKYLYVMYGERYINEMAVLKKSFDANSILGRENIFDVKFLMQ